MIYLDSGATSFPRPAGVIRAVDSALRTCANPGRGGYPASELASRLVFRCRERAAALFDCRPEQVVLTGSCTHGLNLAIGSVLKPGGTAAVSGFEHNAVMRPLYARDVRVKVCGRRLFDRENTLEEFHEALQAGVDAAVFTHVSNVFGYILPVEEMAAMCREKGVPFIVDAAQSAGTLPLSLTGLGADFIAMPGHKGLLGPQGTGLLLCAGEARPLLYGGTGSQSLLKTMPEELPERLEPGTVNVPGAAGLLAGMETVGRIGQANLARREGRLAKQCAEGLEALGYRVFRGQPQAGTVSFQGGFDCEEDAQRLAGMGIAVRAGLHCAPLAHESAGTVDTGTIRVSFGWNSTEGDCRAFLRAAEILRRFDG